MPNARVLLVDDEPQVRSFIRAFLLAARFDVIEAGDGVEALDMLVSGCGGVDLLITDINMPRMVESRWRVRWPPHFPPCPFCSSPDMHRNRVFRRAPIRHYDGHF